MFVKESRISSLLLQYYVYLKPVDESEVSFSHPNERIWPSLGHAMARNPEIDWTKGRLTALWTPDGSQWVKFPEDYCTSPRPDCSKGIKNEPPPGIQLLRPTALDHLWASEEEVEAFPIRLNECQGWLGASLEDINVGERNPKMLNTQAGAAAVIAAEEWHSDSVWMTATGSPIHERRHWTPRVVC